MSHLTIQLLTRQAGHKTDTWQINSAQSAQLLGVIVWYSPWRRYVLSSGITMWDAECLREVIEFIEARMAERVTRRKKEQPYPGFDARNKNTGQSKLEARVPGSSPGARD